MPKPPSFVSYCAEIKRGERVPHPRWWPVMRDIGDGTNA